MPLNWGSIQEVALHAGLKLILQVIGWGFGYFPEMLLFFTKYVLQNVSPMLNLQSGDTRGRWLSYLLLQSFLVKVFTYCFSRVNFFQAKDVK